MRFERLRSVGRRRSGGRLAFGMGGFAAGAAAMYFLDPRRGAARRADVTQRAGRAAREAEQLMEAGARDLAHRARGVAAETRARISPETVTDDVIAERVRARLGRLVAHPHALHVTVRQGTVELSGPVFRSEHHRVTRSVRLVRGVHAVTDRLDPHDPDERIPALQGGGPARGPVPEALQRNWSPGTRLLAGGAGALLLARVLSGGGVMRIPLGLAVATMLRRSRSGAGAEGERGGAARRGQTGAGHAGARDAGAEAGGRGGAGPSPEVVQVKSPAEMEPGIAHASPTPTFRDRVDRPHDPNARRTAPATPPILGPSGEPIGSAAGEGEEVISVPVSGDVAPREGLVAPGSDVREEDLGILVPREGEPNAEEESERREPGGGDAG